MIDLEDELRRHYAALPDDPQAEQRITAELLAFTANRHWTTRHTLAAVAASAVVAGSATLWASRSHDPSGSPAAGATVTSCSTSLPADWSAALAAEPITVGGEPAYPAFVADSGDVVVRWRTSDDVTHLGVAGADGSVRTLLDLPPGVLAGGLASDGRTLVVGWPDPGSDVTAHIATFDLASGARTNLLPDNAVPAGFDVRDGVGILDGTVYFGASPRPDGRGGAIVAHDLADGTSRVVAQSQQLVFVSQDASGVRWGNGGVRASGLPAAVPGFAGEHGDIYGDGAADYAWSERPRGGADEQVVDWAGPDGVVHRVRVRLPDNPTRAVSVESVAGAFVVLSPYPVGADQGQLAVLDTRTGAVAELGVDHVDTSAAHGAVLAVANEHDAAIRIDTSELSGLHC